MIGINMGQTVSSSYDFEIYPGPEGIGTFLFSLFVDDSTQNAVIYGQKGVFITVNNQSLTDFPIELNCQKTFKVNKVLKKVNGVHYSGGLI
jgi:hypothetical protein